MNRAKNRVLAAESAPAGPGCLIGDWYIAEDQMQKFSTALSDTNSNLDIALTVTVADTTTDGTDLADSILASAPINSAPYECGDVGPTIQFDTGEDNPRVPIQLPPAD